MKSTTLALLALGSLASVGSAQTPASSKVIVPCTQPAPPGSLVAQPTLPLTFTSPNDVVVMEMESQPPIGNWSRETATAGFSGDAYFRWAGPNFFGTPNVDTLTFRFNINTAGDYVVRMRVRHDNPDWTEGNDCWVRLDGGKWEKLYHNTGPSTVGVWTFNALYEATNAPPQHTLNAGEHIWEVSGRSTDFLIDRIDFVPVSIWKANLADTQSDFQRARPLIDARMIVEIDDPTGSAGMAPGVARTAWYVGAMGAEYPCGKPTVFGEDFLSGPVKTVRLGPFKPWMGPGQPNVHRVQIPNNFDLVGLKVITQSVLIQPDKVVFGEGLELTIGDV